MVALRSILRIFNVSCLGYCSEYIEYYSKIMSAGPQVVCIKRKRTEQAPDALLLERPGKRVISEFGGIQYVRQKDTKDDGVVHRGGAEGGSSRTESVDKAGSNGGNHGAAAGIKDRRTFHLKHPVLVDHGHKRSKRKHDGVATFVERNAKRMSLRAIPDFKDAIPSKEYAFPEAPLKRPGRRAAVNIPQSGKDFPTNAHNTQVDNAVANSLHEFAQQVVATESKPHLIAVPKLPPHRSRELHRQSALRNVTKNVDQDGDADMEDEADYVYDTYILAPSSSDGAVQANAYDSLGNVGYLVITEEDQDVWETYLEDEPSDKDWNSDEEDENAEDWYGADYPDEELASDDEFGRNEHSFRTRGAADDEEWDEDTGNFSDEEYDRQMHPWKKMSS